jgi:hypothetical protein
LKEATVKRSIRVIAVGGALVASAFLIQGATADASSGGPGSHPGSGSTKTLQFDVQFSPFNYTDLGKPGPSAADVIVFHDTLLQHGSRVGDEVGSCVLVDPTGLANCTAVVRLGAKDTITYALVNAPPPRKVVAITGGSGAYRTAHGDGVLVENGDAANTGTLTLTVITG